LRASDFDDRVAALPGGPIVTPRTGRRRKNGREPRARASHAVPSLVGARRPGDAHSFLAPVTRLHRRRLRTRPGCTELIDESNLGHRASQDVESSKPLDEQPAAENF
jgi:hypothetical protein